MVSDLPTSPRLAYVGTDHYRAGRTAAFFVSRMARRPGPVIVLTHSFDYRAHAERVSGFRDGLVDHGPDMRVVGVLEGHDRQVESEELVVSKMRSIDEDIVGLYNTGGANRAVERALSSLEPARRPVFVGHELTVHTARMLSEGAMILTIDQNPEEQARRAADVLLRRFGYSEFRPTAVRFLSPFSGRKTSRLPSATAECSAQLCTTARR